MLPPPPCLLRPNQQRPNFALAFLLLPTLKVLDMTCVGRMHKTFYDELLSAFKQPYQMGKMPIYTFTRSYILINDLLNIFLVKRFK